MGFSLLVLAFKFGKRWVETDREDTDNNMTCSAVSMILSITAGLLMFGIGITHLLTHLTHALAPLPSMLNMM